jgi:hypothetical protein
VTVTCQVGHMGCFSDGRSYPKAVVPDLPAGVRVTSGVLPGGTERSAELVSMQGSGIRAHAFAVRGKRVDASSHAL